MLGGKSGCDVTPTDMAGGGVEEHGEPCIRVWSGITLRENKAGDHIKGQVGSDALVEGLRAGEGIGVQRSMDSPAGVILQGWWGEGP